MKRKLMWLNLVLVALNAAAGWRLRQMWIDAQNRQRLVLSQVVQPPKSLPPPPIAAPPSVVAASYLDVADKMLFAKDRNPTVVVEPEPPKQKPPLPPLPTAHGLMFLDPPVIILAAPGGEQKSYRAGDQVGKFKLISFNRQTVTFEWEGDKVEKRYEELLPKEETPAAAAAASATGGSKVAPVAVSASPSSTMDASKAQPGVDMGTGVRACQTGDTSPAGAVVDGYKKVQNATPFGTQCFWEPVKK